jgi:hypothetical protein
MTNEWNFVVEGSGEISRCEQALIIKESQAMDYTLSFGDVTGKDAWKIEPQGIEILRAIETTSGTKNCKAKYVLQAWDSNTSGYVDWDDLVEEFKAEITHQMHSWIHFDENEGNFYSQFFYQDIDFLRTTRFTDANNNVAMKFRILAIMPGSRYHGPSIDREELINAEFKIKLVADSDVVTCKNNELIIIDETTYNNTIRETSEFTL